MIKVKLDRATARAMIVSEARKVRRRNKRCMREINLRHLDEAVAIVRHAQTVDGSVLIAAGFNEKGDRR